MAFLLAGALALEQLQQQPTAGNEEHTTEALARVQTLLKSSRAAAAKHTPMQADGALEYCMLLVRMCAYCMLRYIFECPWGCVWAPLGWAGGITTTKQDTQHAHRSLRRR